MCGMFGTSFRIIFEKMGSTENPVKIKNMLIFINTTGWPQTKVGNPSFYQIEREKKKSVLNWR